MSTMLEPPASLPERRVAGPAPRLRQLTIALAGNPNAGKTSLFNALTGLRQKVANYPGVTVERKEGQWALDAGTAAARLVDLPGLYSLDAKSIDEQIAQDVLTGRMRGMAGPDLILAVVDATSLARNLYLVRQLMEMERPLVIALTMMDLAERRGIRIDVEKLSRALGVGVVPVVARQRCGLDELGRAVFKAQMSECEEARPPFNLSAAQEAVRHGSSQESWQDSLLDRYRWIEGVVAEATEEGGEEQRRSITDRIDNLVTHKFYGPLILLFVMLLVFQAIFPWANVPMNLIDEGCGALGQLVRASLLEGLLTDLLVNGIIAGVGGVLVFLPQILLLFFFISVLEDSGYMARAAFLMDRLMRSVGLHGKAFMPLLLSFACAIPGIMATRTIENPKDRLATIMIAPFMSCSARLPVYTLMIATRLRSFCPLRA